MISRVERGNEAKNAVDGGKRMLCHSFIACEMTIKANELVKVN